MGSLGNCLIDTGNEDITMATAAYNAVLSAVGNCVTSGLYPVCPCSSQSSIKSLFFDFNGTMVEVPSNSWVAYSSG